MNVRIEDDDSSDSSNRRPSRAPYDVEIVRMPSRSRASREHAPRDRPVHPPHIRIQEPSIKGPRDHVHESGHTPPKVKSSRRRKSTRSGSRRYAEQKPDKKGPPDPPSYHDAQDSDDVLDEWYGRSPTMPRVSYTETPHGIDVSYNSTIRRRAQSRPYHERHSSAPAMVVEVPTSLQPGPYPSKMAGDVSPSLAHSHSSAYSGFERINISRPFDLQIMTCRPPGLKEKEGFWGRAAIPSKSNGRLKLTLRLLLTRKGERYRGRHFDYEVGAWNDTIFAHQVIKEYHSLKTRKIGFVQKLSSYKKISFLYFLQYRAFEDTAQRYLDPEDEGIWRVTDRLPITDNDDKPARSSFMFRLENRVRKESRLFQSMSDKTLAPVQKFKFTWVKRLDMLVEPGAVIDIEVKETFDTTKIYAGLLLAVLLSLGVALLYGFLVDRDFATGFSIASWLLTAFGFFAAVVAAGEYLGLDSPTATLTAGEEPRIGDRDLAEKSFQERRAMQAYPPYPD